MFYKINIKNTLISIAIVFSLLTITSSGIAVIRGNYSETDFHLMMRFFVTTIAMGGLLIFKLKEKSRNLIVHSLHYFVTMGSIFLLVWFSGLFIELHPDAYRDIFLNYSIIYVIITAAFIIFKKFIAKTNN